MQRRRTGVGFGVGAESEHFQAAFFLVAQHQGEAVDGNGPVNVIHYGGASCTYPSYLLPLYCLCLVRPLEQRICASWTSSSLSRPTILRVISIVAPPASEEI